MQTDPWTNHSGSLEGFFAEIMRGLLGGSPDGQETAGDSGARQFSRAGALAFCMMAFRPRDMEELTTADHCLLFHRVLEDGVDDMIHERDKLPRRKLRVQVNTTGRISLSHDRQFYRLRRRKPSEIVAPFPTVFTAAQAASGSAAGFAHEPAGTPAAADPLPNSDPATNPANIEPASIQPASIEPADPDARQPSVSAHTERSAANDFTASEAEIMAAARIVASHIVHGGPPEIPPEPATDQAAVRARHPAGTFRSRASAPPSVQMPPLWPETDAGGAANFPPMIEPSTASAPAIEPTPKPPAIRPMNRAQRRLAKKLAAKRIAVKRARSG